MNQVLERTPVSIGALPTPMMPPGIIDEHLAAGPGRHELGFVKPTCWRSWTSLACWCTACGWGSVLIHPHHLDF